MEQFNARCLQIWHELETTPEEQNANPPTLEELVAPKTRAEVGLQSLRIRKITWEIGRVAEEGRSGNG